MSARLLLRSGRRIVATVQLPEDKQEAINALRLAWLDVAARDEQVTSITREEGIEDNGYS